MKKLTKRLASGLLTALLLVTSLPVDSLAKSVSTITGYTNDAIYRLTADSYRNFTTSSAVTHNLTFDNAGDSEGQSILTKADSATHGGTEWYFHQAGATGDTISPGEITSDGGIEGSGKYLKIYGDSFFQMGMTRYAVTNNKNTPTGYEVSFDFKSEVSNQETPNAFFFRGDTGDGENNDDGSRYLLELYESDKSYSSTNATYANNPFVGGTGIALWVSDKHTLTLVIKRVHSSHNSIVDNEMIDFYVEEDLTDWNNYRIVDNGRIYNASNKDYYSNQADITFYLNGRLLFKLQCNNYGAGNTIRGTGQLSKYHASGATDDEGTGITVAHNGNNTDWFYRSCTVKDAGGLTIKTIDGTLIRDYSRFAFTSRVSKAEMGIDNFTVIGYSATDDEDAARVNGYNTVSTSGAIYLPITIRDYNNDGMLFEYNDQWEGGLTGIGTILTSGEVKRHNVGWNYQTNLIGSGWHTLGTAHIAYLDCYNARLSTGVAAHAHWTLSNDRTYYTMKATTTDPQIDFSLSDDNQVYDNLLSKIVVRYRTTTANSKIKVYYRNSDGGNSEARTFAMSSNLNYDGEWHLAELTQQTVNNKLITGLRFDFLDGGVTANESTIDIQYVALVSKETTTGTAYGTDDVYPYYTYDSSVGYSKGTQSIGAGKTSLTCNDYRYALVRYCTTDATELTVNYLNDSTVAATSGAKTLINDGVWHDIFVRVSNGSTSSFTTLQVKFNGKIKIASITPLKYVRFEGSATYKYVNGSSNVYRDENGKIIQFLAVNVGSNLNMGNDSSDKRIYWANVRYKTDATSLTLVAKTRDNSSKKLITTVSQTFDTRADNKYHTAVVRIDADYYLDQLYVTCDDDSKTFTPAEVIFFHYDKDDANAVDLCKFYATYYNPNYEYSKQTGNNLIFGMLVYQYPTTTGGVYDYYNTFNKSADSNDQTLYFGTNHRNDGSGLDGKTSGNQLLTANSYSVSGTFSSSTGYLTFNTIETNYGRFLSGVAIQCLTEAELDSNGKPVYNEETVKLLASALAYALRVGISDDESKDAYGFYNRVVGEVNDELYGAGNDFASFIRECVKLCSDSNCVVSGTSSPYYFSSYKHYYIGDYDTSDARRSDLTLDYFRKYKQDTSKVTCMDFALYMLDNLFVSGQNEDGNVIGNGYSMEISEYDTLALIQTKNQNGENIYTFSSARSGTEYDTTNRVIYNTQTVSEPYYKRPSGTYNVASGYPYYEYMFNPLGSGRNYSKGDTSNSALALGYGDTDSKYLANDGVSSYSGYGERYEGYNYNFSMEGIAKFVYHEDDNLFFRFMGDDDVYLFINGKLVLDIGGGHSRADIEVYLNEANTKHDLGLVDGEEAELKFLYMERHGFAANFSIQTNIRMTDPSMPVDKIGYVGGEELAYGDNVQKTDTIEYEFTATCVEGGKADSLQYFYFDDNDLGFELGYTAADSNSFVCNLGTYGDTKIARQLTDLSLFITNADDSISATCADMSETGIKEFLAGQVTAGKTLHLKGVKYKLTEAQISAMTFKNLVNISSYYSYGGFYHKLDANSAFLVNVSDLLMYLWAGHDRTYNFADLLTDETKIGDSTYGDMKSGTIGVYISDRNKKSITNASHSISGTALTGSYAGGYDLSTAKGTSNVADAGISTFYFTLIAYVSATDSYEKLGPFGVKVYTYDVSDANYVLDYGLPVLVVADPDTSNKQATGFLGGDDVLSLASNTKTVQETFGFASSFTYDKTTGKLTDTGSLTYTGTGKYGTFAGGISTGTTAANMTYTPNKFIQGVDSVKFAVGVIENGAADYTIRTGVQMYKTINFMPASIMYYEESIGSISYNQGMTTGTAFTTGAYQSSNQDESYGYDSAYSNDQTTTSDITQVGKISWWGGKKVITRLGSGGFDGVGNNYNFSNGTYAKLDTRNVDNYKSPVASFDFTGTGFELISYTNYASATVRVDVIDKDTGTKVKGKLVITTYGQGSLNQVPIIDIDGLNYDEYTVNIYVIKPLDDGRGVMFYLDGVRIYNPTTDKTITDNYKDGEAGATIEELRADILKNNNTVAVINQKLGQKVTFTVGQSYVERVDGNVTGKGNTWNYADSTGKFTYENVGPNNEIYLKGQVNALVFRVKPTGDVDDVLFEIEAKTAKQGDSAIAWRDCTNINSNGDATYPNVNNGYTWVDSYTSRYYAMDVSKCIQNSDGTYTVIVLFITANAVVSLTNVKYNNCTLEPIDLNQMITENGTVAKTAAGQLLSDVMTVMDSINEGYEINEDLVINSVTTAAAYEAEEDVIVKVSASADAETVYVLDSDGNEVEVKSVKSVAYGDNVMFTVNLGALSEGTYSFTFDVADSDGRTCADTVTKTIIVEE